MAMAFFCPDPDRVEDNKQRQNDYKCDQKIEKKFSQAALHIRSEIDRVHHCLVK